MQPPTHGIDDLGEYVDITDPAWDWDRLKKETEAMQEAKEDPGGHPLRQYLQGLTRWSLDAEHPVNGQRKCAREYFKSGVEPTIWTLRRIGREAFRRDATLRRRDELEQANDEAMRKGIRASEGPRAVPLTGGGEFELTDTDMTAIWESDPTLPDRLGPAVIAFSRPLSAAEGKR